MQYPIWYRGKWRLIHRCPPSIEPEPDPPPRGPRHQDAHAAWRERRQDLDVQALQRMMSIELIRQMAIENGEMEGVYRIQAAAKEWLILNGLERAEAIHQVNPNDHSRDELRRLLGDQQQAVEDMVTHAAQSGPMGAATLKDWHREATRHQRKTIIKGLSVPYRGQGRFRRHYEQVLSANTHDLYIVRGAWTWNVDKEIDQLCEKINQRIEDPRIPTHALAAWAQLQFIRIHPFSDGNSRTSRLLGAWIHARRGEHPPVIRTRTKKAYHRRCYPSHEHPQGDQRGLARLLERASVSAMRQEERVRAEREEEALPTRHETNWEPKEQHYTLEVVRWGMRRKVGKARDIPEAGRFWATWTGRGPSAAGTIATEIQHAIERKRALARG